MFQSDTVLLICEDHDYSTELLQKLADEGMAVVGPVPTAGLALAMAAQAAPTVAVVATAPTGKRGARELAENLMRDWGIRSWIMDGAHGEGDDREHPSWAPQAGQMARLRRALS